MKTYGLIGFPLSHSFSKKYFTEKFLRENITNVQYELFEIENVQQLPGVVLSTPGLKGLNVTIPHKENVIEYMSELDEPVKSIQAVNVIKVLPDGRLKGYNSDYHGFRQSLLSFLPSSYLGLRALILGTGGASKAVKAVLEDLAIPFQFVSRKATHEAIAYEAISTELVKDFHLIINTSPLGMYPNVDNCPDLPYEALDTSHFLFDLVYNPEETLFMKKGSMNGAHVKNGLEMLIGQAEKAWEIWNS